MRTVRTEHVIDAPPADVWSVLTDLPRYREWNPLVTDATGDLREGGKLRIRVRPRGQGSRRMPMKVRVTDLVPNRRLEWVGKLPLPGLFRGEHVVELEPLSGGRTLVHNDEDLSGLLVPLVVPDDVEAGYEAMNRALGYEVAARYRD